MIEIMGRTFAVMELLLLLLEVIFALGLLQMGFWGLGKFLKRKIYFPFHYRICQMVFDNLSNWWKKAKELLFYKPQGATVFGFFRRKERHISTDILGALYQAAYFLNRQSKYQGVIAIFSDMKQEPSPPTLKQASDLKFPEDTDLHCFYVNASGRSQWEKTINTWVPIFEQAELRGTGNNFCQRGEIGGRFDEVFPNY